MKSSRFAWVVVVGGALVLITSCAVPPKVTWQRIQEEGLVRTVFGRRSDQPRPQPQMASTTSWGSAQIEGRRSGSGALPTAEPFAGKVGFVYSPHTQPKKLVNVAGFAAGEQVLCPYTLEAFVVPSFAQGPAVAEGPVAPPLPFGPATPQKSSAPSESIELVSRDPVGSLPAPPREPPVGQWVEGKPGFVYSPFAAKHQLVDVTGIGAGVEVRCPYTRQIFRVPEPPAEPAAGLPDMPAPAEPTTSIPIAPPPPAAPERSPSATPAAPGTSNVSPPSSSPRGSELPVAKWVEGKPGVVQSPFGEEGQLVDIGERDAGSRVVCPFTGKTFLVPVR